MVSLNVVSRSTVAPQSASVCHWSTNQDSELLDVAEGARGLGHDPERDLAREVARRHHDEREHVGRLVVERLQPSQALVHLHVAPPVIVNPTKGTAETPQLVRLAGVERDALGVLAHAGHSVTEIRVIALHEEVDQHERAADRVGQPGAERGVEDADPHHVARDHDPAEDRNREVAREVPQHDAEGAEGQDLVDQRQPDHQGLVGERVDVLLDPLLRIVGGVADQFHPIVGAVAQPGFLERGGEPASPPYGEELPQPDLIDRHDDVDKGENHPVFEGREERPLILVLQGVEEPGVPGVEELGQVDREHVERDDDHEQSAREPLLGHAPSTA